MHYLGECYTEGLGVTADAEEAVQLVSPWGLILVIPVAWLNLATAWNLAKGSPWTSMRLFLVTSDP